MADGRAEDVSVIEDENVDDSTNVETHQDEDDITTVRPTDGWFKRVERCLVEELTLLSRCVGSASPDRSSAAVLFLVLFATSITCLLSRYLMTSQPERFPSYVVTWLIICYEAVAIVCLVLMLCYARTRPTHEIVADADLQPWHRLIRRNIKLFGIVPFYFAIFVFDVFRLIAKLQCVDAWVACSNSVFRLEHITDLLYPVARTVCLCIEMIVCVKFNAADFFQNTLVLVGLAVVQATNLSCWLDALVDESAVFSSERNSTYELSRCFNNATDFNASNHHYFECFRHETGEFRLLKSASPYLFPFIMEYLMLVIECIADWFFSDARKHAAATQPPPPAWIPMNSLGRAESGVSMVNTEPLPSTSHEEDQQLQQGAKSAGNSRASLSDSVIQFDAKGRQGTDTEPLIVEAPHPSISNISDISGSVHVEADMVRAPETWYDRCPWFFVGVIFSSVVSFLFVIFGIYNFFLGAFGYQNVFMCYRSGYWLALSLAALIGYAYSRRFPSGPTNPNGFEYFVILACIGPILQSIFTIVANVQTGGLLVPMGMFLTEEITNILQICTQVVFYAYAKSVQIRSDENNFENDCQLQRKRSIFMGVISYFVVCNFALWVEDSFIETRSSENSWQKNYFDNWPLIYNTFNPLSLVFRFNSVLLFLDVLFDKRRQQ